MSDDELLLQRCMQRCPASSDTKDDTTQNSRARKIGHKIVSDLSVVQVHPFSDIALRHDNTMQYGAGGFDLQPSRQLHRQRYAGVYKQLLVRERGARESKLKTLSCGDRAPARKRLSMHSTVAHRVLNNRRPARIQARLPSSAPRVQHWEELTHRSAHPIIVPRNHDLVPDTVSRRNLGHNQNLVPATYKDFGDWLIRLEHSPADLSCGRPLAHECQETHSWGNTCAPPSYSAQLMRDRENGVKNVPIAPETSFKCSFERPVYRSKPGPPTTESTTGSQGFSLYATAGPSMNVPFAFEY